MGTVLQHGVSVGDVVIETRTGIERMTIGSVVPGFFLWTFASCALVGILNAKSGMINEALEGLSFLVRVSLEKVEHGSLLLGETSQIRPTPDNWINLIFLQELDVSDKGERGEAL